MNLYNKQFYTKTIIKWSSTTYNYPTFLVHLIYQEMSFSHQSNNKPYILLLIIVSKRSISKLTSLKFYPFRLHIKLRIWSFHQMGWCWLLLIRLDMQLFSILKGILQSLSSISKVLLSLHSSVPMVSYLPLHNSMVLSFTDRHVSIVHFNPSSWSKNTKIVTPPT